MKGKYAALAVLLYLFSAVYAVAQPCRIKVEGYVTDESDGQPLEFVTVFLKEFQKGASTDSAGKFNLDAVCSGWVTIQISHVGCETVEKRLEIRGDTVLYFTLPHSANMLESVDISSEKLPSVMTPSETLSAEMIDQTRGATLAGALESVSGVTSLKTGSSIQKPVIHGLYGNRVLIFNNGVRLESQQWGNEHAPEVDPFVASKLTVVKGAGSVRYGSDALGGVVLAEPSPLRDSAGTGGQLDMVAFTNGRGGAVSGMLEHRFARLEPLSMRIQGTLKRSGNNRTPDYYLKNTGMSEFDFSWALNWKKKRYGLDVWYSQFNSELGIFSGSHIGNLTDFENALQSDTPAETSGFSYEIQRPYQNVVHELVKAGGWISTGEDDKLSLLYSRQYNLREEYDKDVPLDDSIAALNLPELSYELTSHIADLVWEHYDDSRFSGVAGINAKTAGNTFEGRYFIPNYELTSWAVFVSEKMNFNSFGIEAGARYEVDKMKVYINTGEEILTEPYDYSGLTGSLSASWRVDEHWDLLFNTNTAWRAPSVNELYADGLHHGAAAVEIGDKNLDEEKALSASFSVNYQMESRFLLSLTAYHSTFNGFIYLQPEPPATVIIQGTFPTFYYRQTDATVSGADLTGKWNTGKWFTFDLRVAGVVARNTTAGDYLPGFPPFRTSGGVTVNFGDKNVFSSVKAGLKAEYVAEQTLAPETDYVPPPDAYALLTLSGSCTVNLNDFRFDVSLTAENLLNTPYRDYLNRYRYYADDMGRNVTLRIKIPFNS